VLLKDWHMSKDEMTRKAIASSNIVINLIGSSLETRNFSFEDIHTDWPKKLAGMVAENAKTGGLTCCFGVLKFISPGVQG
jgi:NADH dehydrogenase (ubiquinone) 1 alpha subcomplex subunit 9